MLEEGFNPDHSLFLCMSRACAQKKAIREGFWVHALIIEAGFDFNIAVGNTLIDMYAKCGSWEDARTVFHNLQNRDMLSWGALITASFKNESSIRTLHLFERMNQKGLQPDKVAFSCAIKLCSRNHSMKDGMLIYDMIVRTSFESNVVVANSLIDMFSKAGCLIEAQKVFSLVHAGNIVSWNAMIAGHVQHGNGCRAAKLFEEMQQKGIQPDKATYVCILRAFSLLGNLEEEYLIHTSFTQSGLRSDTRLANTLINVYSKFGRLEDAFKVFSDMPSRDAVSWSVMVAGYAQHEESHKVFGLLDRMSYEHVEVDQPLFLCMLKACTCSLSSVQGRSVHNLVIVRGFDTDNVIGNALVDMYAKCGSLSEAYAVFERASHDMITWSTMISALCYHGHGSQAIALFHSMQKRGFGADRITLTSMLKACAMVENLQQGMSVHDEMVRMGVHTEAIVGNALVDFYAKCASLNEARKIFDSLPGRDMVTWGAIITGYGHFKQYEHALKLFEKMQKMGIQADEVTFSCILKACTGLDIIEQGKLVHDLSIRSGYTTDALIGNTLIDMYSKSGLLDEARKVFDGISRQDTVTWNAMIAGYVQHNHGFPALALFDQMQEGIKKPDNVTYTCILKACGCVGAIAHGRAIHDKVIRTGAIEQLTIGATLVDMYANCGCLDEACRSFEKLATRNVVSWNAMIAGYAQLGSLKLASECLQSMQKDGFKPDAWSYTSILAACSHEGLVEEGWSYFERMRGDLGAMPSNQHLNCMIELLGSAGRLHEAEKLLQSMPVLPNMTGWMTLLGACTTYGDFGLGRVCFDQAHDLDSTRAAGYVLMSKICSDLYKSKEFDHLQDCREDLQAWKKPGQAWIEIREGSSA
ncbi:hypothetical protein GOP47_0020346 [Adiantum capillus-veneris]|uniref:Pentatricopeptide repeat-containing protein n=1 Tax=Adiantum capillus-veneris TaxID=13818 RepID=A0A9D4ZAI9_ADICA|nr:hypothetical protein GOP47_0020346 [Adiantum capillus-veneris]